MNSNPKISIIMPVYNKEDYLENTITSVLKQSFEDFELIIINDGSTDRSYEILKRFNLKDSRIRIYSQKNRGVSVSRNKALDYARGIFITFLDADDLYTPLFLEKMYKCCLNRNVTYCGSNTIYKNQLKKVKMNFSKGDILTDYLKYKCFPNMNSWMIRNSFIKKYDLKFSENISLGEDILFFSKVLFYEKKVVACEEYLNIYRIDIQDSLSVDKFKKINEDILWINELEDFFLLNRNSKNSNRIKKSIDILKYYRLPAAIVYKLKTQALTQEKFKEEANNYIHFWNKWKYINGLRSLKLLFNIIHFKIKLL